MDEVPFVVVAAFVIGWLLNKICRAAVRYLAKED